MDSQPVPIYTWVPPFPTLVSVVALVVVLFLFASIYVVSSLIETSLLRPCPSNHGLPVEVKLLVLFYGHGPYGHNDSTVIPVLALAPARLISYLATPHT